MERRAQPKKRYQRQLFTSVAVFYGTLLFLSRACFRCFSSFDAYPRKQLDRRRRELHLFRHMGHVFILADIGLALYPAAAKPAVPLRMKKETSICC